MASDSDVEAYLHQLSKKTYSIKKDLKSWKEPPLTSSSSESEECDTPTPREKSSHPQKYETKTSVSDNKALNDTYSDSVRKSYSHDRFSILEHKYLRKYDNIQHKKSKRTQENSGKRKITVDENVRHKTDRICTPKSLQSDTSSVDEELANYLNETSLLESLKEKEFVQIKQSQSEECDESTDDILDIKNIMTIEDILDPVTKDECSESSTQTESPSAHLSHSHWHSLTDKKDGPKIKGDLSSAKSEKEIDKSKTLQNEINPNTSIYKKASGMLLTKSSSNVFHSSQRKSSLEFSVVSSDKFPSDKRDIFEQNMISENICSVSESNTIESVTESEVSKENESVEEQVASHPYDIPIPQQHEQPSKETASVYSNCYNQEKTSSNNSSTPTDENSLSSNTYTSKSSSKLYKDNTHRNPKESSTITTSHRTPRSKSRKSKLVPDHKKESKVSSKKSTRHKKHKSPTSSSTSSESSESESDECCCKHRYKHKHKSRRSRDYKQWDGPVRYMQMCANCCTYVSHPPLGTFTNIRQGFLESGLRVISEGVAMDQVMRQQVALTKQFLDSQRAMYQAYTSILTSNHHYTSLYDAEKYIKKKQPPPLTFKEAYRLVEEEMKASER